MSEEKLALRVPEPAWLSSRARNAARRPLVIGTIAIIVTALAIVSIILAPKHRAQVGPSPTTAIIKVDTVPLALALAQSQARVTSAESALVVVRRKVATAATQPAVDSLDPKTLARHDSLTDVLTELGGLIGKAESIPLPSSYRALASAPAIFNNARVHALLDSLSEVEKERENYDASGGA